MKTSTLEDKIILVTGATGKQGGATARHLVAAGVKVRALTRKPDSKAAEALKELGIEVVKGNLNYVASVNEVMKNVYGVFSIQNGWEFGTDEAKQNKNIADAAKQHGIGHLVFASIARCDDNPNLKHFVSKYKSEQYLKESGIPLTALRAVYFMDNLKPNAQGLGLSWEMLRKNLGSKTTLQMIACEDIGWFAANAFLNPKEWIGKTIDIAGDNVTYPEALAAYEKIFGITPKHSKLFAVIVRLLLSDVRKMFEWYREPCFNADIDHLKKIHPGLLRLEDYFRQINSQQKHSQSFSFDKFIRKQFHKLRGKSK